MTDEAYAIGAPKHGNHAVVKALQLLAVPARVCHAPWAEQVAYVDRPRVFIKRDPRNAVCSWIGWRREWVAGAESAGIFLSRVKQWDENGQSLFDLLAPFEGWLTDPSTLIVRYEDLVASEAEMRRIAAHVGVPYLEGAFEKLPKLTLTWRGGLSDYRRVWTDEAQAQWRALGGDALLERWGYR